jgi:predicted signal transduction protein with EAL and GGDEF domain
VPWNGLNLEVGISVGVAPLIDDVKAVPDWMACADQACYSAKAASRGTVSLYQKMQD